MSSDALDPKASVSLPAEDLAMTPLDAVTHLGSLDFFTSSPAERHPGAVSETGSSQAPLLPRAQQLGNATMSISTNEGRLGVSHPHLLRPLEIVESIRSLHELHQKGGLTNEEFAQAKQHVLESCSSSASTLKSKSKQSRRPRHHRRSRRSHNNSASISPSTRSRQPRDARARASGDHSFKTTSHRYSRSSSSSSSKSSSSSSSSNRFIIVARSNVWRTLNAVTEEGLFNPYSMDDNHLRLDYSDPAPMARSPLLSGGGGGAVVGSSSGARGGRMRECCNGAHRRGGYGEVPSEDPLINLAGGAAGLAIPSATASTTKGGVFTPCGSGALGYTAAATGGSIARHATSPTGLDGSDKTKYGALLHRDDGAHAVVALPHIRVELHKDDVVCITYFNSRGGSGSCFTDVELHPSQMRDPIFAHKGQSHVMPNRPGAAAPKYDGISPVTVATTNQYMPVSQVGEMPLEERRAWEEMSTARSSSTPKSADSSYFEQSFNWYWVDVTGRDASRQRYTATLRYLTQHFKLCESFLVDREHHLTLPGVFESPIYPGQFLLNLRVASDRIAISDDSVMELTNRWIIVVDLKQHIVITLHRVDTHSMANLRSQWKRVIENSDVSFQEFLLKIIDDAIHTYQLSLDVHTALLEKCEAKLFVEKPSVRTPGVSGDYIDMRILRHFAGSSRSKFLHRLLDEHDSSPMNKGEMNGFLHHLHRRTSVQHRMLTVTQTVLAKAFTKLRLCSREMAEQMCASCIEINDRAMGVRDDAKALLNLHISLQSFRTNELMAVLTRVTMLFTPVTFLAGVYGMNFQKHFPELTWEYGYPFFWIMCIIVVIAMHTFFVREH
ncbi:hypothetical protein JKF63_06161 [Porcisia hertigi]|uniref:Uncharacterized protein n=1 Tax=Porcisia hertigi TaxID=2761500 RepID=A0A836LFZ9_9TRYP|nr:hypothetical protein JKF63_06161 [Porcisia hertigi]